MLVHYALEKIYWKYQLYEDSREKSGVSLPVLNDLSSGEEHGHVHIILNRNDLYNSI